MIGRRLALLALVLAGAACADEDLDTVRVCGALGVPADLVAVRVVVLDEALREVAAGVAELADGAGAARRQLPIDVSVARVGGVRVVRAQALDADGVEIGRAEVLVASGAADGPIVVNLERDCLGEVCTLGQTCVAGSCTVIPDAAARASRCDPGDPSGGAQ